MNETIQAKKFFMACRGISRHIDVLRSERSRIMAFATRCTPSYSGIPHASGISDKVGEGVMRLDELERELSDEIDFYERLCFMAHEVIREIADTRYRDILMLRYLDGQRWEKIAEKMGYESNYIWRVHGYALLEAQSILDIQAAADEEAAALIGEACRRAPDLPERKFAARDQEMQKHT